MVGLDGERHERGSNHIEQKLQLSFAADVGGRSPARGATLALHEHPYILPPQGRVGPHAGQHLLRYGHLQHRLEAVLSVEVGA